MTYDVDTEDLCTSITVKSQNTPHLTVVLTPAPIPL